VNAELSFDDEMATSPQQFLSASCCWGTNESRQLLKDEMFFPLMKSRFILLALLQSEGGRAVWTEEGLLRNTCW